MTTDEILKGIAESFNRSQNEIILTILMIISFIALITIIFIIRMQYEKSKLKIILSDRYNGYINEYALTPAEEQFIRKMSLYLKTPEKKYLLFTNQHVFNNCLFEMKKTESIDRQALKSLLDKLQFLLFENYHLPRTSKELLQGKHFMLVFGSSQKVECIVDSQSSTSMTAVCDPKSTLPKIGEAVEIYTYNALGIIHFSSVVQDKKENTIKLAHTDNMEAVQRRHFFRKELQLPVYIHSESSADPAVPSTILDLSAGGMSVKNPSKKFKKGDDVKITMHGKHKMDFDLYGEVVRTSRHNEIAHIVFGHFSAAQKDSVIRFLNTKMDTGENELHGKKKKN